MKIKVYNLLISFLFVLISSASYAQGKIAITITPDHKDWIYKVGQEVTYNIVVTKDKQPIDGAKIRYTIAQEKMPYYIKQEALLKNGKLSVTTKGMDTPGFLTCRVFININAVEYNNLCQVGFEPKRLRPTTNMPDDFMEFWRDAIEQNDKIAMNPILVRDNEFSTDKIDCYYVRICNMSPDSYIYGRLAIPKGAGTFPAVLQVPGAGVARIKPNMHLAQQGVITFAIGIHGIAHNMADSIYKELADGALKNYNNINLDIRDQYYYKRVYLGCLRAVDFIFTLPEFDKKRMAVSGGSQGGGLSLVTAGLDDRIRYVVCFYPALCDMVGYLHGRAGGWPHMFDATRSIFRTKDRIENSKYFDAANFARLIKAPGFYSWGYNDLSCPITSMYSAYNVITAPKELLLDQPMGHARSRVQNEATDRWLLTKFGIKK